MHQCVARSVRRPFLFASIALVPVCFGPSLAMAGIILTFPNIHVATPTSGPETYHLDIPVSVVGTVNNLAGYNVKIDLAPPTSQVQFVGAEAPPNPIFAQNFGVFITGSSLAVADFLKAGDATIADGANLIRASFTVSPNTVGQFPVVFDSAMTAFFDHDANDIPVDALIAGTIFVPEPSAIILVMATAISLLAASRLK